MWRCGDKWDEYAPDKGATTHPRVELSLIWIVDVSSELMSSSCILTPCDGDVLPSQPCALASNVKITQSQTKANILVDRGGIYSVPVSQNGVDLMFGVSEW